MILRCSTCAGESWAVAAPTRSGAALRCATCRSVAHIRGAAVVADGVAVDRDGTPEALIGIGGDPADPWVVLEVRLLASQRDVVSQAITAVTSEHAVTAGQALEWIAADFLGGV